MTLRHSFSRTPALNPAPLRYPRRVSPKCTTLGATITIAYAAYLHAVDRPGVVATDPVAGLLYDAGIAACRGNSKVAPCSRTAALSWTGARQTEIPTESNANW